MKKRIGRPKRQAIDTLISCAWSQELRIQNDEKSLYAIAKMNNLEPNLLAKIGRGIRPPGGLLYIDSVAKRVAQVGPHGLPVWNTIRTGVLDTDALYDAQTALHDAAYSDNADDDLDDGDADLTPEQVAAVASDDWQTFLYAIDDVRQLLTIKLSAEFEYLVAGGVDLRQAGFRQLLASMRELWLGGYGEFGRYRTDPLTVIDAICDGLGVDDADRDMLLTLWNTEYDPA